MPWSDGCDLRILRKSEHFVEAARTQTKLCAIGAIELREFLAAPSVCDVPLVKIDYLIGEVLEIVYAVFGDEHRCP